MLISRVFQFETTQGAYRFLNSLKNWSVRQVTAKYASDNQHVQVSYEVSNQGFDSTAAELDDLAATYDGKEAN